MKGSRTLRLIRRLENQSSADNDTAIATVRGPLIQERSGIHGCGRNTEVAGIRGVEHVGAELYSHPVFSPTTRVLDDPEVHIANAVGAQDVTSGAAETFARGSRSG